MNEGKLLIGIILVFIGLGLVFIGVVINQMIFISGQKLEPNPMIPIILGILIAAFGIYYIVKNKMKK